MNVQIEESWKAHLQPEFEKDYFRTLTDFVRDEYGKYAIYPPGKLRCGMIQDCKRTVFQGIGNCTGIRF